MVSDPQTTDIPAWKRAAMWADYNRGGVPADEISARWAVPAAIVRKIVGEKEPVTNAE